jgi:hypothetical protein
MSEPNMCGGHNRAGEPCGKTAGFGTSHPGFGNCKHHGGASPSGNAHAARLEAETRALKVGDEVPVDPGEALLWAVRVSSGALEVVRQKLAELQEGQSPTAAQILALVKVLGTETDRVTRIAKVASEAGVEERRLQLDSLRLDKLAEAIQAAISDAALDPESRDRLNTALRTRLAELSDEDLRPRPKELRS